MPLTQQEIAFQMIRQLRILDPSVSADLGTPERKILDTVAQALADAQIDLTRLTTGFEVDSKVGQDLDRFLALFGFARQDGAYASGVIEFSRTAPSNQDIPIPAGTQVAASIGPSEGFTQAIFSTTSRATLPAGDTSVFVPIRAANPGAFTNVAANSINLFVGSPLLGITGVTNPVATVGGRDLETDNELKVRFRNTLFRNVAGTEDQYLALSVAGAFSNKAVVVGPISRYREYIQVPFVDDASTYDVNGDGNPEGGNGTSGEYTTALSTNPYTEYTYNQVPVFVSNGESGSRVTLYTEGVDYDFNTTSGQKYKGDAYRLAQTGSGPHPLTDTDSRFQPNITFTNVYTGPSDNVEAIRPGDILLLEYSYISSASRNDFNRNITNCVDVYVNGANPTRASTVIPRPSALVNQFENNPTYRYHFENFRRAGEPEHRPIPGNVFSPLFWNPLVSLPDRIVVEDSASGSLTYRLGVHYWPIVDVSENGGTIRSRTGIEWSVDAKGEGGSPPKAITNVTADDILIEYFFDRNIVDVQTALEASKQITTDVLIHQSILRYFKLDITVMYAEGVGITDTNGLIRSAVQNWFNSLYFGSTIQISDLLQVIHNVSGVDNIRWTSEVNPNVNRVTETDSFGNSRLGIVADTLIKGTASTPETQHFYLTGEPEGGTYTITQNDDTTEPIAYDAPYAAVNSAIQATDIPAEITSGEGTPESPFRLVFNVNGAQELLFGEAKFTGERVYNDDFFLKDNELPALADAALDTDTLPGLIIRPRAQNTWKKS